MGQTPQLTNQKNECTEKIQCRMPSSTLWSSALALCYSVAQYRCPVLAHSSHTDLDDRVRPILCWQPIPDTLYYQLQLYRWYRNCKWCHTAQAQRYLHNSSLPRRTDSNVVVCAAWWRQLYHSDDDVAVSTTIISWHGKLTTTLPRRVVM